MAMAGLGGFGGAADAAARQQMAATDQQQAATIRTQIAANAQKQAAERWKIMTDTQTKIFEIIQDVTTNRLKAGSKAFNAMDQYIRM